MAGAAGFTFAIAVDGRDARAAVPAPAGSGNSLNPWVSIAVDGTIFIMSPATEMGQGTTTALPLILAEELDADWSKVRIIRAPPIEKFYGNPGFGGMMYTAGSNSIASYYTPLRTFGAQVRRVLLDNAARHWNVPVAELSTQPGVVVHGKSGRRLDYGEIASFAIVPDVAPDIRVEDLKPPRDFRLIGKEVMRAELPSKINGSATYAIDVQVPGMVYGAVLRSPVEGGVPDKVDDRRAKAVKGVLQIVSLPYGMGVIAETVWAAFSAKSALEPDVTWKRSGAAWGFDSDSGLDAFATDARASTDAVKDWFKQGDAASEIDRAAVVLDAEYRCDYAYHAQMEPLNAVASISSDGNTVEVWCGTQSQTMAVDAVAKALNIPRENVKLNYTLLGGGFGRRGHRDEEFIIDAVLLTKSVRRPVKVIWTREDDFRNGRFRPMTAHYLRAGVDGAGNIAAWHQRIVGDRVAPFQDPVRYDGSGKKDFILMAGSELRSYDIPHQYCGQLYRESGVRTSSLRGIGFTANKFAAEAFLDEIAQQLHVDPVKLRLDLLKNTPRGRRVVERVAQMSNWGVKRDGRGFGFAFVDYSGSLLAGAAEVSIERSTGAIKVHNFWCAMDCGIAVQPDNIVAQTESSIIYGLGMALTERISIKDGSVEQSNFYDYEVTRVSGVPAMHIEIISTDNHPTGAGQMATPLVAPAVSSAVAQLTGVRLRETPMTPERVKKALA
jgi:isoquinoline 1-oxidoreductase beta subunit